MTRMKLGGLATVLIAGCGRKQEEEPPACNVAAQTGCEEGRVCEPVQGGEPDCFAPLWIEGAVFDTSDGDPVEGALVVARDVNGAAVSPVAASDVDGLYALRVPATRDAEGNPVSADVTLRADAAGYLPFPKAPRSALPVDLADAGGDPLVVANAATDVGLIPLEDTTGLGTVEGTVEADLPGGTLVVAGGATGIADVDGAFTVFDVPAGTVEVIGLKRGINLSTATVDVVEGETADGVVLSSTGAATAEVTGTVQIVNAPGGLTTSVILVAEDTFDEVAIRGEAPPGLRVGDVEGGWSISQVPDGRYVVLAAFETDQLVRDPDTSIGGTDIVHIEVAGGSEDVPGFKVTEGLEVLGPGAGGPELVEGPVTLSWVDDSSEDLYEIEVVDALGDTVWTLSGDLDPGGSAPVEVAYDGPLEPGMYYQFRVTSSKDGVPLSTTEDLEGVFFTE